MKNSRNCHVLVNFFFHRKANEDAQKDVSKSTVNKESNADKTAVIIRSPQTATVYLSSTKRPDHLSARAGLASKKGEGSNVEDSNTDEEEMAKDK